MPLVKFTLVNANEEFETPMPLILNTPPAATVIEPLPALNVTLLCCISNVPLTVNTFATVELIVAAEPKVNVLATGIVKLLFIVKVAATVRAPFVDFPSAPLTVKLLYANAGIT